jgi:hypothetical protein
VCLLVSSRPFLQFGIGTLNFDEVALTLNRDTDTKLVIVGKHSGDETSDAAAQRDLNVTQHLLKEKGIDPSCIELRTGGELNRGLDDILVASGAIFIPGDTKRLRFELGEAAGQLTRSPKTATTAPTGFAPRTAKSH